MSTSTPMNVSFAQAQDLQRQLESVILKLEKASLLQENAGDHIRVIAAEGIAEHFGDRYRTYPTVPRLENVPIRRDMTPGPCVLAAKPPKKKTNSKGAERIATTTTTANASSPGKTATTTNRGTTPPVSAWAAGVANASSASTSPEKSIIYETKLAANASRWEAILDNPIKSSPYASRPSNTLTGRKVEKRTMASSPIKEESCGAEVPKTSETGAIKTAPTGGQSSDDNTEGVVKVEDSARDAVAGTSASITPPKTTPPSPPMANTDDWLIDLSP